MAKSEFEKAKEMVMSLSAEDRDAIYKMLLGDRVKNDVLSILRLGKYEIPPEEEREAFAKEIAEIYVFRDGNERMRLYNSALTSLIDEAIEEYFNEKERS